MEPAPLPLPGHLPHLSLCHQVWRWFQGSTGLPVAGWGPSRAWLAEREWAWLRPGGPGALAEALGPAWLEERGGWEAAMTTWARMMEEEEEKVVVVVVEDGGIGVLNIRWGGWGGEWEGRGTVEGEATCYSRQSASSHTNTHHHLHTQTHSPTWHQVGRCVVCLCDETPGGVIGLEGWGEGGGDRCGCSQCKSQIAPKEGKNIPC